MAGAVDADIWPGTRIAIVTWLTLFARPSFAAGYGRVLAANARDAKVLSAGFAVHARWWRALLTAE